ncbi:MAG TPA: penicillin-binding transpeptidase domain-containing protein, partial [Pyrinomonadaceae bacterium]|nr:penicillin-binding transpeptidase domain-containing protein [Pyrinomonadaceae bacterium]
MFKRASRRPVLLCVCALAACAWAFLPPGAGVVRGPARVVFDEEKLDAALQRAARAALAGRDGAVLVLDAQTGRLRAAVNSRLAFEEAFPPGSTVKPFTTLAALRSGAVGEHSRSFCPGLYDRQGLTIRCSHPRLKPPFNLTRALAYSCNHFFAQVGEGLNENVFTQTLDSYGFGARTGAGGPRESGGQLPRGPWKTAHALGAVPQMLVTPAQLVAAYVALFNGGRLYAPSRGAARGFVPAERGRTEVPAAHRALLVEGMRGAIAYGTAERAGLSSVDAFVFGKTGTATAPEDFRTTHGWFVGLASDAGANSQASPDAVRLAVLVFLKRATGGEAAEVSRAIFEEYSAATQRRGDAETRRSDEARLGDEGEREGENGGDEQGATVVSDSAYGSNPGGGRNVDDESNLDDESNPSDDSHSHRSDSSSHPPGASPRHRVPASHVRVRVSRADSVLS